MTIHGRQPSDEAPLSFDALSQLRQYFGQVAPDFQPGQKVFIPHLPAVGVVGGFVSNALTYDPDYNTHHFRYQVLIPGECPEHGQLREEMFTSEQLELFYPELEDFNPIEL